MDMRAHLVLLDNRPGRIIQVHVHVEPECEPVPWRNACACQVQRRSIVCMNLARGVPEPLPVLCNMLQAPAEVQSCYVAPCGANGWKVGDWGPCSRACGGGECALLSPLFLSDLSPPSLALALQSPQVVFSVVSW